MKSLKLMALCLLVIATGTAHAQLAGKNVILVHGLQADDLADNPSNQQ